MTLYMCIQFRRPFPYRADRSHRDIHNIFVQKSGGTEINEWPKDGMFYS